MVIHFDKTTDKIILYIKSVYGLIKMIFKIIDHNHSSKITK